jgi:hypothetical protein
MSEATLDRDTRRRLLLAAAISQLLAEQGVDSGDPCGAAWARTGHQGLAGAWAWSPRSPSSWRLAGRLDHHRGR